MSVQFNEENGGKVLTVHVSGKLEKVDYELLVPEFERLVSQHGKLSMPFDMTGFHGWEASALKAETKPEAEADPNLNRRPNLSPKPRQSLNLRPKLK